MPDGVTPAPADTQVAISFGDLTVTTDADGRFDSLLPIPAGTLHAHGAGADRDFAASRVRSSLPAAASTWTSSCSGSAR